MDNNTATARPACGWCGKLHGRLCPYVKAIEFYDDGVTVKRVEFVNGYQEVSHARTVTAARRTGA